MFISAPRAAASRQPEPGQPGRGEGAAELADRGHEDDQAAQQPRPDTRHQADPRAHAGEGEEGGQQQHRHDLLHLAGKVAGEGAVVRHDGPEQKRSEDRVDADQLGGQSRRQEHHEDDARGRSRQALGRRVPGQSHDERPDEEQHDRDVGHRAGHDEQALTELRLGDADHERQQAPGGHVVGGRAAQGDDAQLGPRERQVGQDAGQHGKGGDRHGHAHEQGESW